MAEAEIREAVASEMEELLRDMEASYKVSLAIDAVTPSLQVSLNVQYDDGWTALKIPQRS